MREVRPLNHGDIDCSGHNSGGLETSVMGLNLTTLSNSPSVTICNMCGLFTFPIIPMLQTACIGFMALGVGHKSALWLTISTLNELHSSILSCIVYCCYPGLCWERLTCMHLMHFSAGKEL